MTNQKISITTYIASTQAAVWKALTDPDLTQQYWGGNRIESDWKVGSKVLYRVDGKVTDENTVLVVEPLHKLSYTFRPVFGEYAKEPASRVTFTMEQNGDVVRLDTIHEDFPPDSKVFIACSQGWPPILIGLKALLETQTPVIKHFVVIFGPPAVGKMAVGREIEAATGLRLFHNHMSIEPVLRFFQFGTPAFVRLVDGFRTQLFEEVADSDLPGLIFTFVWNLDGPDDTAFMDRTCQLFRQRGHTVAFVELRADLAQRLVRNRAADRLDEKPSKRDVERSEEILLDLEKYRLNTDGTIPLSYPHLLIDNTELSAAEVAHRVIDEFGLAK